MWVYIPSVRPSSRVLKLCLPRPTPFKDWEGIWRKHNLGLQCRFNTTYKNATWDDAKQCWRMVFHPTGKPEETYVVEAEVFVSAIGGFSMPLDSPPDMKGLSDFKGIRFHSANWDYSVDLKNKRVGVIGNGCSAAQFVPKLAEEPTTQVINFSRTPSWFYPRVSSASCRPSSYPSYSVRLTTPVINPVLFSHNQDQVKYSPFIKWCFAHVPGFMETYRRYILIHVS